MGKLINPQRANLISFNASKVYCVNPMKKGRYKYSVWCRTAIAVVLREEGNSWYAIGEFLYKSHATIIYLVKKHSDHLVFDKEYKAFFDEFQTLMKKPQNSIPYLLKEISFKVAEIILTLKSLDYSNEEIDVFFEECIRETKLKIA